MFPRYCRKLPSVPSGILNMFNDSSGRGHPKDSSEHQGRIRTFQHEVGNWASLVYIPGKSLPPANEVWGKVVISEACVSHCVHRGEVSVMISLPVMDSISTPPCWTTPPPGQHPPPQHALDSIPLNSTPLYSTTPWTAPTPLNPLQIAPPPGQYPLDVGCVMMSLPVMNTTPWTAPTLDSTTPRQQPLWTAPALCWTAPTPCPCRTAPPPGPPPSRSTSGRYASYWNAFLFKMYLIGDMFFELTAKV